jgi:hypothetical protein
MMRPFSGDAAGLMARVLLDVVFGDPGRVHRHQRRSARLSGTVGAGALALATALATAHGEGASPFAPARAVSALKSAGGAIMRWRWP